AEHGQASSEGARSAERGRDRREGSAAPHLEPHDHVRQVQCAGAHGQTGARRRAQRARVPALRRTARSVTNMTRLSEKYRKDVVPQLMKEQSYGNVNQVPRLEKVVLNMGLGEAIQNAKIMDSAVAELTAITGQKPVVTKSRKAIANFKLRENMAIG